ncbi:uncharacterized protein LOC142167870 [Nicotiana tabacum]|uniref:Uncharacterized protein LOC142167870 n=1 Tax=Nicotiana tabacum TaxID=4097 RepID=A0AC58SH37_TOBAC
MELVHGGYWNFCAIDSIEADYKALVVCSVLSEIKATISRSTSYHHLKAVEEKKCSWYKCNTDGASKGNPGPSSLGFCVRDDEGDVVYARAVDLGVTTNVMAEAKAILQGLEYCVEHDFHPLILETDSLVMKKAIEGNGILLGEGNSVADFIASIVFSFAVSAIRKNVSLQERYTCRTTTVQDDMGQVCDALSIDPHSRCCRGKREQFACHGCYDPHSG